MPQTREMWLACAAFSRFVSHGMPPPTAAVHRSAAPVLFGERGEFVVVPAHEVFVRGHHVLPGAQRGRHVFIRRVQAAHDLHDGVDRRVVENVLHLVGGSGRQLAEIAPAQHPRRADIVPASEHIVNALPTTPKPRSPMFMMFPHFVLMKIARV